MLLTSSELHAITNTMKCIGIQQCNTKTDYFLPIHIKVQTDEESKLSYTYDGNIKIRICIDKIDFTYERFVQIPSNKLIKINCTKTCNCILDNFINSFGEILKEIYGAQVYYFPNSGYAPNTYAITVLEK